MREEKRGAHLTVAHAHELPRIAERIVDLGGDGKLKAQRALHGVAHLLLLRGSGDLRVFEQADDGQARIGRMEVGPRAVVGAPCIAIAFDGGEPRHQMSGALVGSGEIDPAAASPGRVRWRP